MDYAFVEIFPDHGGMDIVTEMLEWTTESIPFLASMAPVPGARRGRWRRASFFTGRQFYRYLMFNAPLSTRLRVAPFVIKMRERDFILWRLRWLPRPLTASFDAFYTLSSPAVIPRERA